MRWICLLVIIMITLLEIESLPTSGLIEYGASCFDPGGFMTWVRIFIAANAFNFLLKPQRFFCSGGMNKLQSWWQGFTE